MRQLKSLRPLSLSASDGDEVRNYDAFISYSHVKDKPVAAALQSVIQTLGKPWWRVRMSRVFRDDTSLSATPSLWPTIEKALSQSQYLILLASPEAAVSPWVSKEVKYWLTHKSLETLLIALTDGELRWDVYAGDFYWTQTTPLPVVLTGRFDAEPLWVDLRPYRAGDYRSSRGNQAFQAASAALAATIRRVAKEDLLSEEGQQQRRNVMVAWAAAMGLMLLFVAALWLAYLARTNEERAKQQRDQALTTQSRLLAKLSEQKLTEGDAESAALIALQGLPDDEDESPRPYVWEAEHSLYQAHLNRRLLFVLDKDRAEAIQTVFPFASPTRFAVGSDTRNESQRSYEELSRAGIGNYEPLPDLTNTTPQVFDRIAKMRPRFAIRPKHIEEIFDNADVVPENSDTPQSSRLDFEVRHRFSNSDVSLVFDVISVSPEFGRVRKKVCKGRDLRYQLVREVIGRRFLLPPIITSTNWLLAILEGNDVTILDLATGSDKLRLEGHSDVVRTIAINTDGSRALTSSEDLTVRLWDLKTGEQVLMLPSKAGTTDAVFSPDEKHVWTLSNDGSKFLWSIDSYAEELVLRGHTKAVTGVVFSPDGRLVATSCEDNIGRIWDATTGQKLSTLEPHAIGRLTSIAFGPTGKRIVTASSDKTVRVWGLDDIKAPRELANHPMKDGLASAAFCGDVNKIVVAGWDKTASVIDATTGKVLVRFSGRGEQGHGEALFSAWCSANGERVLTSAKDDTVRLWDGRTGRQLLNVHTEEGDSSPDQPIGGAVFSQDGKFVAIAAGRSIRVVDAINGKVKNLLEGHNATVSALAFSPDGARIISGDRLHVALIWDVHDSQTLATLDNQLGDIVSVAFSPRNDLVATAAKEAVHLTRIFSTTSRLVAYYKRGIPHRLTPKQRERKVLSQVPRE